MSDENGIDFIGGIADATANALRPQLVEHVRNYPRRVKEREKLINQKCEHMLKYCCLYSWWHLTRHDPDCANEWRTQLRSAVLERLQVKPS